MTLREQIEEQNRQWRLFHEWEKQRPPDDRRPASLIADIGAIYELIPAEVRTTDRDPEKLGIRKMLGALAKLSPR